MGNYKQGDSYIWKGIIRAKNNISDGYGALLGNGNTSFWYDSWLGTWKLCLQVPFVNIADTALTVANLWRHGTWCFNELYTNLPHEIKSKICNVRVPQSSTSTDKIRWRENHDGFYTTASAYDLIAGNGGEAHHTCWRNILREEYMEEQGTRESAVFSLVNIQGSFSNKRQATP